MYLSSMLARDFCFWLQGAVELGNLQAPLTTAQTDVIARHLSLVVPSPAPAAKLPRADAFVHKMRALHEVGVRFEDYVWDKLMVQLNDVFEHQLDKEVPFNPEHSHGDVVVRC